MFIKSLPLLFISALCPFASAATYQLSISNTISSVYNFDTDSSVAVTPYGNVAGGSTLTLTLTYDIEDFIQTQAVAWPGGSGVQFRSSSPAVLSITVSSGYSYSGPLGGNSSTWFSLYNQDTAHDQGNYLDATGNILVQFNDYASSSTFTGNPIAALSVEDAHAAFAAAVNSGVMSLANGLPGRLPGVTPSIYLNASDLPTVSLLPVTAVPEPAQGVMAATALIGLMARRRRAARTV